MSHFMLGYFLVLASIFFNTSLSAAEVMRSSLTGAHLQGKVKISITVPEVKDSQKIQRDSPIRLSATIKNVGDHANAMGEVFIRFALQKPLDDRVDKITFETEKRTLPSIKPGSTVVMEFDKVNKRSALFDYIRDKWSLHEYEVISIINGKTEVLGRATISVSAHYYEDSNEELPSKVDNFQALSPSPPIFPVPLPCLILARI